MSDHVIAAAASEPHGRPGAALHADGGGGLGALWNSAVSTVRRGVHAASQAVQAHDPELRRMADGQGADPVGSMIAHTAISVLEHPGRAARGFADELIGRQAAAAKAALRGAVRTGADIARHPSHAESAVGRALAVRDPAGELRAVVKDAGPRFRRGVQAWKHVVREATHGGDPVRAYKEELAKVPGGREALRTAHAIRHDHGTQAELGGRAAGIAARWAIERKISEIRDPASWGVRIDPHAPGGALPEGRADLSRHHGPTIDVTPHSAGPAPRSAGAAHRGFTRDPVAASPSAALVRAPTRDPAAAAAKGGQALVDHVIATLPALRAQPAAEGVRAAMLATAAGPAARAGQPAAARKQGVQDSSEPKVLDLNKLARRHDAEEAARRASPINPPWNHGPDAVDPTAAAAIQRLVESHMAGAGAPETAGKLGKLFAKQIKAGTSLDEVGAQVAKVFGPSPKASEAPADKPWAKHLDKHVAGNVFWFVDMEGLTGKILPGSVEAYCQSIADKIASGVTPKAAVTKFFEDIGSKTKVPSHLGPDLKPQPAKAPAPPPRPLFKQPPPTLAGSWNKGAGALHPDVADHVHQAIAAALDVPPRDPGIDKLAKTAAAMIAGGIAPGEAVATIRDGLRGPFAGLLDLAPSVGAETVSNAPEARLRTVRAALDSGPDLSGAVSGWSASLDAGFPAPDPADWAAFPERAGRYGVLGSAEIGDSMAAASLPVREAPTSFRTNRTGVEELAFPVRANPLVSDATPIRNYTRASYYEVNQSIAASAPSADAAEMVRNLMQGARPLAPGTQLKRATDVPDGVFGPETAGKVLFDPAIVSTSWSPREVADANTVFNITAGPGVVGLYVGQGSQAISQGTRLSSAEQAIRPPFDAIGLPHEKEVILPPGSRFLVTRVRRRDDKTHVDMVALPNYRLTQPGNPARTRTLAVRFPEDPGGLILVRPLGGSTGAELVRDAAGAIFVRKTGNSPDHIREEAAADALYAAAGARTPPSRLYETPSGPVKLAGYLEGARPLGEYLRTASPAEAARVKTDLRRHFVMDALLANHDVIGLAQDNVLIDRDGAAWRVDNGGSLRYRAQGGAKPGFGDKVAELRSMRDPGINANAAAIFAGITNPEIKRQILHISARKAEILSAVPPGPLRTAIFARIRDLETQAARL